MAETMSWPPQTAARTLFRAVTAAPNANLSVNAATHPAIMATKIALSLIGAAGAFFVSGKSSMPTNTAHPKLAANAKIARHPSHAASSPPKSGATAGATYDKRQVLDVYSVLVK